MEPVIPAAVGGTYMERTYGHLAVASGPAVVEPEQEVVRRRASQGPKHSKTPPLAARDIVNRPTIVKSRRTGMWLVRVPGERQPWVFPSWESAMHFAVSPREFGLAV